VQRGRLVPTDVDHKGCGGLIVSLESFIVLQPPQKFGTGTWWVDALPGRKGYFSDVPYDKEFLISPLPRHFRYTKASYWINCIILRW
jgi:hypothetical protein